MFNCWKFSKAQTHEHTALTEQKAVFCNVVCTFCLQLYFSHINIAITKCTEKQKNNQYTKKSAFNQIQTMAAPYKFVCEINMCNFYFETKNVFASTLKSDAWNNMQIVFQINTRAFQHGNYNRSRWIRKSDKISVLKAWKGLVLCERLNFCLFFESIFCDQLPKQKESKQKYVELLSFPKYSLKLWNNQQIS